MCIQFHRSRQSRHFKNDTTLGRRIAPETQRLPLQVGQRAPHPLHGAEAEASRPPLTRNDLYTEDHHRPDGDADWPQPKGLTEAGQALGMHAWAVWFKIKMPMALRSIIPPLGNQWIFIMKATTVGVAIGFSDLFYIVSTSITQSGQTLELIFILMSAFLLVNFTIAQLVNLLNAHLALKGH